MYLICLHFFQIRLGYCAFHLGDFQKALTAYEVSAKMRNLHLHTLVDRVVDHIFFALFFFSPAIYSRGRSRSAATDIAFLR